MNRTFLIGRLIKDPELKFTPSGIANINFTLAVNRQYKNQNGETEADFINCVAWRKTAEILKQYTSKGSQIAVDGRIQTRNYEASDGTKRYLTEVICESIQLLGNKKNQEQQKNAQYQYEQDDSLPRIDIGDDNLPF